MKDGNFIVYNSGPWECLHEGPIKAIKEANEHKDPQNGVKTEAS